MLCHTRIVLTAGAGDEMSAVDVVVMVTGQLPVGTSRAHPIVKRQIIPIWNVPVVE